MCGQSFESPDLHPYAAALDALDEAVDQVATGKVNPALAPTLFSHLLGAVQQVLDVAREDLAENLRRLQGSQLDVPEEARQAPLEFIEAFAETQNVITEQLATLRDVFATSASVADFQRQRPLLDHAVARLRNSVGDLEHLQRMTSDPLLTVVADEPMPEEVSISVHQFELAMAAMGLYYESREREHLEKCLLHLDEARNRLKQVLMLEALGGQS